MSLTALILGALIVALAVLLVRAFKREGADGRAAAPDSGRGKGAEGLLAERFARGEIDDEEYERRLAVLRSHAPGPTFPRE